jgi:hypothetical protein
MKFNSLCYSSSKILKVVANHVPFQSKFYPSFLFVAPFHKFVLFFKARKWSSPKLLQHFFKGLAAGKVFGLQGGNLIKLFWSKYSHSFFVCIERKKSTS